MKELSIEEKAHNYDEAIKRANSLLSGNQLGNAWIYRLLPELEENGDERIKNEIIQFLQLPHPQFVGKRNYEEWISWLKKQGEQKSAEVRTTGYWNVQDIEQKPADETKFKVGDWVVYCNDDVDLITGIEENGYCINNCGYIPFVCESDIRLWTIQDAKDGDVLVASDGSIFIFKGTIDCACKHYVALTTDGAFKFNEGLEHYWETSTAVHPAPKEQRDLLFQKMHEAGYEWDAEKKELKKKSTEEYNITGIGSKHAQGKLGEMIKNLKSAWSEEDEKCIENAIMYCKWARDIAPNLHCYETSEKSINWLKSLKDRVQPKQEWSKEDKVMLDEIIDFFENGTVKLQHDLSLYASWLKSIRPQNTWKPSEEMLEALYRVIPENVMEKSEDDMLLDKLYQGLKYGKVLSEK